ncbi:hypothetical protein M413DRAFT_125358 [Hebeloma cylindrosporum]|uniref:Uncharacterized protein n=1 Tax=Hebeloma cylindrosporum TaxID=76867 RepID=A0A0C3C1U3_HEBCY|nr:hypothetical protein M413DRAFT_125358 [Hebeloma cylindrosporum h7]
MCKTVFSTVLAISPPIPIRFGCSRACFVGGGYRNLYPYPYPPVPYPQPVRVPKPLTITTKHRWRSMPGWLQAREESIACIGAVDYGQYKVMESIARSIPRRSYFPSTAPSSCSFTSAFMSASFPLGYFSTPSANAAHQPSRLCPRKTFHATARRSMDAAGSLRAGPFISAASLFKYGRYNPHPSSTYSTTPKRLLPQRLTSPTPTPSYSTISSQTIVLVPALEPDAKRLVSFDR